MVGGIGGGMNSQGTGGHVHHVTECIHEEKRKLPQGGAAASASARANAAESVRAVTNQETQWDLFAWVGKAIGRGTNGISSLFGLDRGTGDRDLRRSTAEKETVMAQLLADQKSGTDRAAYLLPAKEAVPQNSWFQSLKTRASIRFGSIRDALTRHLKQEQDLQMGTGKQRSSSQREKENQRRLEVRRPEEPKIQCSVTDDSYLLDSYNKKGDYSRLGSR